jgi:hypothetical protein
MCLAETRNQKSARTLRVLANFSLAAAVLFNHAFAGRFGLNPALGDFFFGLLMGVSIALNLIVLRRRARS